eukprot:708169-Prorocentrum_minimum.AAC.2
MRDRGFSGYPNCTLREPTTPRPDRRALLNPRARPRYVASALRRDPSRHLDAHLHTHQSPRSPTNPPLTRCG